MNKEELIPAPVDNKNVATDWIEDIFDFQTCVRNKKTAVGFIADEPAIVSWADNVILWSFPLVVSPIFGTARLEELKKRLKIYDDENPELVTDYEVVGNLLMQKFYWNNEEEN